MFEFVHEHASGVRITHRLTNDSTSLDELLPEFRAFLVGCGFTGAEHARLELVPEGET